MREIKFRAWDGEKMVSPDYIDRKGVAHWKENSIPTYSNNVMQFTGLEDKNGTPIYEGDIVKTKYYGEDKIVAVEIDEEGVFPFSWFRDIEWNGFTYSGNAEVIGNQFENPELLNS
jgi:uncharacterized phage protein (TIGR01671 family)